MATAAPCIFEEVEHALASTMVRLPAVEAVNVVRVESEVYVWVGISEDNSDIRKAIYSSEDVLADRFPNLAIEFRVFEIPVGRAIEDFVSESRPVYKRAAA